MYCTTNMNIEYGESEFNMTTITSYTFRRYTSSFDNIVSPDPISTELEVIIVANLGATEQAVINALNLVSPVPRVVGCPS
jgi:hypothetical protein